MSTLFSHTFKESENRFSYNGSTGLRMVLQSAVSNKKLSNVILWVSYTDPSNIAIFKKQKLSLGSFTCALTGPEFEVDLSDCNPIDYTGEVLFEIKPEDLTDGAFVTLNFYRFAL